MTEREWYATKLIGVQVRYHAGAFAHKWRTARGREQDGEVPEFFFGMIKAYNRHPTAKAKDTWDVYFDYDKTTVQIKIGALKEAGLEDFPTWAPLVRVPEPRGPRRIVGTTVLPSGFIMHPAYGRSAIS